MQEQKSKWVKFGAIFAILIMVGSAVLVGLLLTDSGSNKTTEFLLSDTPGTQANFTFKNAIDGSKYLPEGVLGITIRTIYSNDTVDQGLKQDFPGIEADKLMTASYSAGRIDYFSLRNESNASVTINGKPQYDVYEGHNILFLGPSHRLVAGNPLILVTFLNYADNSLAKRAVDVLSGKSLGSTDLSDILSYADDVAVFYEITVFKANDGSNYSKYYQRSSEFIDMTTLELAFQIESIVLQPNAEMKADIYALSENAAGSNKITIVEEGNALKAYIDSSDVTEFIQDRDALYEIVSVHTRQSAA